MSEFATDLMQYTFEYDSEIKILRISASGTMDNDATRALFTAILDQLDKNKCHHILMDYRDFEITKSLGILYERPETLIEISGPFGLKIAGLVKVIDQDYRFIETIYVNSGIDTKIFTDEDDAIHWLIGV